MQKYFRKAVNGTVTALRKAADIGLQSLLLKTADRTSQVPQRYKFLHAERIFPG